MIKGTRIVLVGLAAIFMLTGCNEDEVKRMSKAFSTYCDWTATHEAKALALKNAVTAFTGSPPGLDLGIEVVRGASKAICAEVKSKRSTGPIIAKAKKTGREYVIPAPTYSGPV